MGATNNAFYTSGAGSNIKLLNCDIHGNVYAISLNDVSSSLVSRCKVHDNQARGVMGQCGANCVIEYCEMYNNVSALLMGGSLTQVQNLVVRYNYAHDNTVTYGGLHGDNIFVFSATNTKMYGNIVKNATEGLFVQDCQGGEIYNNISYDRHSYGMLIDNSPNFKVYNNITYNNANGGIWFSGSANCEAYNNILYETIDPLYIDGGSLATLKTDHNLFYSLNGVVMHDQGLGYQYNLSTYQQNTINEDHGLFGDPLFVDAANGNFHLRPGSPAIDAGMNTGIIADQDGNLRPQGLGFDIGCYETDGIPPNAPTNLQTTSITAHTIALAWNAPGPAVDGDVATLYIIKRNTVAIETTAAAAFTDTDLLEATSFNYQVYAVDDFNNVGATAVTGSFVTITDAVGPAVLQALSLSLTQVQVVFDEPVDQATSEAVSSYQLTGGVTVAAAVRQADQKTVMVTTSAQTEGNQYTITVSNVRDASAAHNTMTSTPKQFTAMYKFEDNFEAGNISKWTPASSSVWTVTDDAGDKSLFIGSAVPAERLLINRTYNLLSFDVDLKGYGACVYRNLSIIIGLQDTSNYYHVNFAGSASTAYNGIFKVVNKVESRLATAAALLTETAQYHHVRVTWNGATGEIKAYFDQSATPAFSAVDTTYRSGKCGLWSKGSKQGYFDNVEVVSYIRTDVWGTGITAQATLTPEPCAALCPNPLSVQQLPALLQKGFKLFDLQGTKINGSALPHYGIYLMTDTTGKSAHKVIIIR